VPFCPPQANPKFKAKQEMTVRLMFLEKLLHIKGKKQAGRKKHIKVYKKMRIKTKQVHSGTMT
jgi:hypothetical protein